MRKGILISQIESYPRPLDWARQVAAYAVRISFPTSMMQWLIGLGFATSLVKEQDTKPESLNYETASD